MWWVKQDLKSSYFTHFYSHIENKSTLKSTLGNKLS